MCGDCSALGNKLVALGLDINSDQGNWIGTEGLLDPTLADEDVDTLLKARRRQIEEFVEDFESALSEMNGESSLTSVPFPLCESTQRRLNELLVKMDGETVEDSETEEVEDSCSASKEDYDDVGEHQGSMLVGEEPPVLRVSSDELQSAPITQVDTAMAFITDKSSGVPFRSKHREPTVSDVTGALGAMRMLREAESNPLCASSAAVASSAASISCKNASSDVLCRFGVIADVQYADKDDAYNFAKTKVRHYRKSVETLARAVDWWNSLQSPCVDFVVNLADLIDGHNRGTNTEKEAMATVMSELERLKCRNKLVHMVGNHELYCFTRTELAKPQVFPPTQLSYALSRPPSLADSVYPTGDPSTFYYSFVPCPGWRIVILDPYDLSVMREGGGRHGIELLKGHGLDPEGTALCQSHNPNDIGIQKDFFQGLQGLESRWVPFNGGFGKTQVDWLRNLLHGCHEDETNVILCSHVVIHPEATYEGNCRTLAWNYEDILKAMYDFPCTKLVLCGHLHREIYYQDDYSIHHYCLPSPMEWDADECAVTCDIMSCGDIRVTASGGISDRYFKCSN
ncbi:hypothetical protein Pmar_PMAR006241 [Perkinsus marinus ATCC 50983]|uniref:Calcineurin-like phosphoesterase domain-containing protein n=1 Tax=Perkinsus marinus (strain ATCC 50983 / TXsc) TaxID=423536 RepID=C5LAH4_PERM5|nr:hypothetical protein Pmar_PMAR006241 [Perkinsus marinus ATCC 50983]EER06430.1 hypothetical protein Pmar_PMAR006241 [Perkinsus marinus ATCC 50983]|eukprot:XP_002774614.1 hypothetical protein Pmar_PMAR006241 [Perkinsus marinus ATCC 50983]